MIKFQDAIRSLEQKAATSQKNIRMCEKALADKQNVGRPSDVADRVAAKLRDIESTQSDISHARSVLTTAMDGRSKCDAELETKLGRCRDKKRDVYTLEQLLNDQLSEIKRLSAESQPSRTSHLPGLSTLLEAIRREKNWEGVPPVGPLVSVVKLRPEYLKWAVACESSLGQMLRYFVVSAYSDQRKLQNLCRSLNLVQLAQMYVIDFIVFMGIKS